MEKFSRNHWITIIDEVLSTFIKVFLPLIVLLFARNKNQHTMLSQMQVKIGIIIGLIVIILLYKSLNWYRALYCIKENLIVVQEGIFIVKRKEIPFNKIQTINLVAGIKHKIFDLTVVKIDTGNSSLKGAELSITIKKSKAERFRNEILNNKSQELVDAPKSDLEKNMGSCSTEFKVTDKELFLVALTANTALAGILFLLSTYGIVDDYLKGFVERNLETANSSLNGINVKAMPITSLIGWVLLLIFIYLIFSFVVSIAGAYIKYYNFTVKREGENIVIQYGLFETKSYVMPVKKITAIYLKQSLSRKLFKLKVIHIETVGYGNEKGEESILYPILTENKEKELINTILPEFKLEAEVIRVPKRALAKFIIPRFAWSAIIAIGLTIKFKYGYISLFFLPIFIVKAYLEYKNSGISRSSNLMGLSNGGFTRLTTIIPAHKIQSIVVSRSYFQKRTDLFNFEASIQGNTFGKVTKIKHLSLELKQELEKLI